MSFESLSQYSSPKEAFLDEDLAKLGDALVNLIYSLAKSKAMDKPDGDRAPNRVLSEALAEAGLRDIAPSRADSHRLGDVAEAVIAYAWLNGKIEIREAVEIISDSLSSRNIQSRNELWKGGEEGFKNLLITISNMINFEES